MAVFDASKPCFWGLRQKLRFLPLSHRARKGLRFLRFLLLEILENAGLFAVEMQVLVKFSVVGKVLQKFISERAFRFIRTTLAFSLNIKVCPNQLADLTLAKIQYHGLTSSIPRVFGIFCLAVGDNPLGRACSFSVLINAYW